MRPAGSSGRRVKKDLLEWAKLGEAGRVFVEEEPQWALHTHAAGLCWGDRLGRVRVREPGAGGTLRGSAGGLGGLGCGGANGELSADRAESSCASLEPKTRGGCAAG